MILRHRSPSARGFTLIELLVAIAVSVVLLSILGFVFKIATNASRAASSRLQVTERMRSFNIRMRQELGAMLPVQRLDGAGTPPTPFADKRTFEVSDDKRSLTFASATVQDGRPVSVDIKYEFVPDPGGDPLKNVLLRWRDRTGPIDNTTKEVNPNYQLGDAEWELPTDGSTFYEADVMVKNVRMVEFSAVEFDIPPGMPGNPNAPSPTDLSPRELPAGIKLIIEFGPETGNTEMTERATIRFPIYRGL